MCTIITDTVNLAVIVIYRVGGGAQPATTTANVGTAAEDTQSGKPDSGKPQSKTSQLPKPEGSGPKGGRIRFKGRRRSTPAPKQ